MTAKGLEIDVRWTRDQVGTASTATDATWGRLSVTVGGDLFWGRRGAVGREGLDWTWGDVLVQLAETWPWLEYEEGWPAGLSPLAPLDFDSAVRQRLAELSGRRRSEEEQLLYEFRGRHDLSRALQGAVVPSLWLVREGCEMWVASDTRQVRISAAAVLEKLEALGEQIADRLATVQDPRARDLREDWGRRRAVDVTSLLEIATNVPAVELQDLSDGDPATLFEVGDRFQTNELMAAARMAGPVAPRSVLRQLIGLVKGIQPRPTVALDDLARRWRALSPAAGPPASPAEEGYQLAEWVRDELALSADDRLEPEELLVRWDVECQDLVLEVDTIDAVAVWGPKHGPAVVVNKSGRHARSSSGRRATLAHEIVHLLVDREGALPLADVVGGNVARAVEQRARAAAAELLVPRRTAGAAFASGRPDEVLTELCRRYGASEELVAWQVRNSDLSVSETTWAFLRGKVSGSHRF